MGITIQSSNREFNHDKSGGIPPRQLLFSRLADILGPNGTLLLPTGERVTANDLRLFALGNTNARPSLIALGKLDTEDLMCFADDVYNAAPKNAVVTRHIALPSALATTGAYGKDGAKVEVLEAPLPAATPKQTVTPGPIVPQPKGPHGTIVNVSADRTVDCGKADPYDRSTGDNGFVRLALVQLSTKLGPNGIIELHDGTRITGLELQKIAMGGNAPAILGSDLRPFAWFCDDIASKVNGLQGKAILIPKVLSDEFKDHRSEYDTSKNLVNGGWQITITLPDELITVLPSPPPATPTTQEEALKHPELYESFSDELKAIPAVAKAAIAKNGTLIRFAPEAIRNDVEMVLLACQTYVWGAAFSGDAIRKSPEAAAKIMGASKAYARNFDPCVYRDENVGEARFKRAFKDNPLALGAKFEPVRKAFGAYLMGVPLSDPMFNGLRENTLFCALMLADDPQDRSMEGAQGQAGPANERGPVGMESVQCWTQRAELDPAFAGLQIMKDIAALSPQDKEDLDKRVQKLHIRYPERFANLAVLKQVLSDAETPNDGRPVALIIDGRIDHNGAISNTALFEDLIPKYRIVYKEAGCPADIKRAYLDQANEPATLVREQTHGSQLGMIWGSGDYGVLTWSGAMAMAGDGLEIGVIKGAKVYLGSCSTGVGKGNQANMANAHAQMVPTASIYAPWDDSNGHDLDKDGHPIWNLVQIAGVAPYEVGPLAP